MLRFIFLMMLAFAVVSCSKNSSDAEHHDHGSHDMANNPNEALYQQVMDVHDEVMPKMDDIYKLKRNLQEQIANAPEMVEAQRLKLEARIAALDSASKAMMDWMHDFNPLPDSADREEAREYLEEEMERIKQVRQTMLEAIDSARQMK